MPLAHPAAWRAERHDPVANEPIPKSSRYVAVLNGLGEFAPVLEEALEVENVDEVGKVV